MNTPGGDDAAAAMAGELYTRYGDAIRRYALRRVGAGRADDVVSDVFLVVASGKRPRSVDEALPWLYAIAYLEVRQQHAAAGRRDRLGRRIQDDRRGHVEPDHSHDVVSADWVAALIDRLAPKDAELLRLVVFEDLSVTSAAGIVGLTPAAAHTRLHRIRRKVQRWLDRTPPKPAQGQS